MNHVKRVLNIAYSSSGHPKHGIDFYIPAELKFSKPPLLIFIHGGAWRTNERSDFTWLGDKFASMGLATAVIGYRLSHKDEPALVHPCHIQDCALAVKWIHEHGEQHLGFKPDKLYLSGHSAGGQLTGLLTLCPEYLNSPSVQASIKGVIGIEGIYDIPKLIERWPEYSDFVELAFTTDKHLWTNGSPQYFKCNNLPPYLILHSLEDELVNREQADAYYEHLQSFAKDPKTIELDMSVTGKHDPMLKEELLYQKVFEFVQKCEFQL